MTRVDRRGSHVTMTYEFSIIEKLLTYLSMGGFYIHMKLEDLGRYKQVLYPRLP